MLTGKEAMPFGKYRGAHLACVRQDANYIRWLQRRPWFAATHPAIAAFFADPGDRLAMTQAFVRLMRTPDDRDCIQCARPLPALRADDWVIAHLVGDEMIGVIGGCCQTAYGHAELRRLNTTPGAHPGGVTYQKWAARQGRSGQETAQ